MNLDFSFVYETRVLVGRRRTEEPAHFLSRVSIDIDSLPIDEAPVVARYPTSPGGPPVGLRATADTFLRPVLTVTGDPITVDDLRAIAATPTSVSRGNLFDITGEYGWFLYSTTNGRRTDLPPAFAEDPNVRVVWSGEEQALSEIREWADGHALVGDLLWRKLPEPVLTARRKEDHMAVTERQIVADDLVFNLADYVLAAKVWKNETGAACAPPAGLEVLEPSAFRLRSADAVLLRGAKAVSQTLWGSGHRDAALAAEIRRLAEPVRRGDPCDLHALASLLEKALDGGFKHEWFSSSYSAGVALAALRVWRESGESLDDEDLPSLG